MTSGKPAPPERQQRTCQLLAAGGPLSARQKGMPSRAGHLTEKSDGPF
jgi:hypothetical protein